jgi:hypothetical protein
VFIVDDLVSWLVGRLADAGYEKLKTRLRGSDQERALKRAVTVAVQTTVDEISPGDQDRAEHLAELINGAFRKRTPPKLPPVKLTRLGRLYAEIDQQLSVLDDGGQTPGGLLGVPVSMVARSLADHLVDEIKTLGAEGGSLWPLADQLNHDRTQSMIAQLLGVAPDAPTPPATPQIEERAQRAIEALSPEVLIARDAELARWRVSLSPTNGGGGSEGMRSLVRRRCWPGSP